MAHFAEIDSNNKVTRVIVVANHDAPTEQAGQDFLKSIGLTGTWLQTSYNTFGGQHLLGGTPLRKNYASIDMTYDPDRDAFLYPSPYPSHVLNEETCLWENPYPQPEPTETIGWLWNEESLAWESFNKVVE